MDLYGLPVYELSDGSFIGDYYAVRHSDSKFSCGNGLDIEIYNNSNIGITYTDRFNFNHDVKGGDRKYGVSGGGPRVNDIVIFKCSMCVCREDLPRILDYYQKIGNGNDAFGWRMAKALREGAGKPYATYEVIFFVDVVTLKKQDAVYLEEIDVVLRLTGKPHVEHPYALRARSARRANKLVEEMEKLDQDIIMFTFEAFDSSRVKMECDRYIYLGNEVTLITTKHTPNGNFTGIRVRRRPTAHELNLGYLEDAYIVEDISFEEAEEKYGIYKTAEEARTLGNKKLHYERYIADITLQTKVMDAEQRREEKEQARKKARWEDERRRLEHEQWEEKYNREKEAAELKHRRDTEKLRKEAKREDSRNFTEFLKIVSGIAAAVLGFVITLGKLKPA